MNVKIYIEVGECKVAKSTRTHYRVYVEYKDSALLSTYKITQSVANPIINPLGWYAAAKADCEVMVNKNAVRAVATRIKVNKETGQLVYCEPAYIATRELCDKVKENYELSNNRSEN